MRVFVTGATGFAGGNLSRILAEKGHQVVALARSSSRTTELEQASAVIVRGDVRSTENLSAGMEGCDAVVHLAAAFREAKLSDEDYHAVNVTGTRNVIQAAAAAGVPRFVHCSTIGVLGDTGSTPADEARPFYHAEDSYNRTKIEGEQLASELFEKLNLPGVIARPTAGYGPGELRYLKLFKGIAKKRFFIFGSGKTLYNLAFIDDLCDGLILCATHPKAVGEVFHLGGAENVTLNRLVQEVASVLEQPNTSVPHLPLRPILWAAAVVETLCKPFGIEPPLHRRRVDFFRVNRATTVDKASSVLGYTPQTSLAEGLHRTADWYRSEGLL